MQFDFRIAKKALLHQIQYTGKQLEPINLHMKKSLNKFKQRL